MNSELCPPSPGFGRVKIMVLSPCGRCPEGTKISDSIIHDSRSIIQSVRYAILISRTKSKKSNLYVFPK